MTSSAAVVRFQASAFDRLVHRAREQGLSLAESRALEWFLDRGRRGRPDLESAAETPPTGAESEDGRAHA